MIKKKRDNSEDGGNQKWLLSLVNELFQHRKTLYRISLK